MSCCGALRGPGSPRIRSSWGFWGSVNPALGSVRMPVLLAVSGLVLSRQVRGGLHLRTTGYGEATNYYLYVVWLAVYALASAVVSNGDPAPPRGGLGRAPPASSSPAPRCGTSSRWPSTSPCSRSPIACPVARAEHPDGGVDGHARPAVPGPALVQGPRAVRLLRRRHLRLLGAAAARGPYQRAAPRGRDRGRRCSDRGGRAGDERSAGCAPLRPPRARLPRRLRPCGVVRRAVVVAPGGLGLLLGRRALTVYVQHPLWIAAIGTAAVGVAEPVVSRALGSVVVGLVFPLAVTALVVAFGIGGQVVAVRIGLKAFFEMPTTLRVAFGRGPVDVAPAPPSGVVELGEKGTNDSPGRASAPRPART